MMLKQGLKQLLIKKEHKKYQRMLAEKKKTYHSWISGQEKVIEQKIGSKYRIEMNFLSDIEKCLKIDLEKEENGREKSQNEGFHAKLAEDCRILKAYEKERGEENGFSFLHIQMWKCACEKSEKTQTDLPKVEKISVLRQIIEENRTDVILFQAAEGELSNIAIPLLCEAFQKNPVLVYGDEDVRTKEGERVKPWFKPCWSPDTFLSYFYFGSLVAVQREAFLNILKEIEKEAKKSAEAGEAAEAGATEGAENEAEEKQAVSLGELLYEMLFRVIAADKGQNVSHISEVLFHGKQEGYEQLRDWNLPKELSEIWNPWTGEEQPPKKELISIIIPSKDNPDVLFTCVDSILAKTETHWQYEIVIVDNGSREENRLKIEQQVEDSKRALREESDCPIAEDATDRGKQGCVNIRYHYEPMEFNFSVMCNLGASLSKGELLLFLNDDMEVIMGNWLSLLAEKSSLPYAGAVGAKLLYPDSDIIQHAGITNLRVGPAHKLQFLSDKTDHYYGKNRGDHDVMAVTGACLMIKRSLFDEAGGFRRELAVAFNDVDFCYSIFEKGFYNIVRNDVVLYHHESLSRGKDGESEAKQLRLLREKDILYEKHQSIYGKDPFYHKYLTTDMLESQYSPAFHYQVTLDMPWAEVEQKECLPGNIREDACVVIGMECAMDIYKWKYGVMPEKGKVSRSSQDMGYYFQGYTFVIGSDNACYKKTLLLQNKGSGEVLMIPVDSRYRQDICDNLKGQVNVELTGFAAKVQLQQIPEGHYRFGMLMEDNCSRQKLVNWSSWVLETTEA